MQVEMITLNDEELAENDYRESVTVKIDGKEVFSICDGEPEDNTISRSFSDVYKVMDLMKQMYDAGKAGIEVTFNDIT